MNLNYEDSFLILICLQIYFEFSLWGNLQNNRNDELFSSIRFCPKLKTKVLLQIV